MKNVPARITVNGKRNQGRNFLEDLVKTKEGLVSPHVFTDPDINRLEMERIFTRSWLYVAHESEISGAGDFVTRLMGEDPVIVWRGQDGQVRRRGQALQYYQSFQLSLSKWASLCLSVDLHQSESDLRFDFAGSHIDRSEVTGVMTGVRSLDSCV